MSYNISVVKVKYLYNGNYTSNVYKMYEHSFDKWYRIVKPFRVFCDNWKDVLMYETRDVQMDMLNFMIEDITGNKKEYDKMNPDNGWGSREGAIKFISDVYQALLRDDEATIKIDY